MDIIRGIFVVLCVSGFICYGVISFNGYRNRRKANKPPKEVYCSACGVKLLKNKASVVKDYEVFFYCQVHKKPYDEISYGNFYKRMRVDSEGEPIGYMKKMDIKPDDFIQFTYTHEGGDKLKDKSKKMPKGKCK